MNDIRNLHNKAMDYADNAFIARQKGEFKESINLFGMAFNLEKKAAFLALEEGIEPTRSVLLRSAAQLAFDCNKFREAEKLIGIGLSHDLPNEIADELRNLFENIKFSRRLEEKGISLLENEVLLSVMGEQVGYGIVQSDEVINRVETFQKLIIRTAERFQSLEFREKGQPSKAIREKHQIFFAATQPGSFSVIMKLGTSLGQMGLPIIDETGQIINEIIENLDLLNANKDDKVRNKFSNSAYFRNFISLSKNLAPDGLDIKTVSFKSVHNGNDIEANLTKSQSEIKDKIKSLISHEKIRYQEKFGETESISGYLRFADSRDEDKGIIQLIDQEFNEHKIRVPSGLMADIVKPLYQEFVRVTGKSSKGPGGHLIFDLEDIDIEEIP